MLGERTKVTKPAQTTFSEQERVHVENNWHDGPRAGIADVNGIAHRFECIFDEEQDEWTSEYLIAPVDDETLALEKEQFRIFLSWREKFDQGLATIDTHPAHGGVDKRWDELERELQSRRSIDRDVARRAVADFKLAKGPTRYASDGLTYTVRWRLLDE